MIDKMLRDDKPNPCGCEEDNNRRKADNAPTLIEDDKSHSEDDSSGLKPCEN